MQKETIDRYSSHLAQNPEDRVRQLEDHRTVREAFAALDALLLEVLPAGRERSLVVTNLEQAAMWANKAVASPYPVHPEIAVEVREGTQGVNVDQMAQATPDNWPRHNLAQGSDEIKG